MIYEDFFYKEIPTPKNSSKRVCDKIDMKNTENLFRALILRKGGMHRLAAYELFLEGIDFRYNIKLWFDTAEKIRNKINENPEISNLYGRIQTNNPNLV